MSGARITGGRRGPAVLVAALAVLVAAVNDSACGNLHNRRQPPPFLLGTSSSLAETPAVVHGLAQKVRHMRGKYTVKEEVVKRVQINHPCQLTRTAVKVTFPSMKHEVLVSFIGYKEPNLMFVNRCKGLCSSDAIGSVACVPTKRRWKKVAKAERYILDSPTLSHHFPRRQR